MPSAPLELQKMFPGGDAEAMAVLGKNFIWPKFMIQKKDPAYEPTFREWCAIDYLFLEWDWGYVEIAPKESK